LSKTKKRGGDERKPVGQEGADSGGGGERKNKGEFGKEGNLIKKKQSREVLVSEEGFQRITKVLGVWGGHGPFKTLWGGRIHLC